MKKIYRIKGMTCQNCKQKIQNEVNLLLGTFGSVTVDFNKKIISIDYSPKKIELKNIRGKIEELGYELIEIQEKDLNRKDIGIGNKPLIYLTLCLMGFLIINHFLPDYSLLLSSEKSISYIILFIIGITTSVHCVSMCGGIVISQSLSKDMKKGFCHSFLYNLGRVLSYSLIGGVAGCLGKGITLRNQFLSIVPILVGIVMILLGISNLLGKSFLKIKLPKKITSLFLKIKRCVPSKNKPFTIGLLNSFMPCGPLQLMQIYSLGTGGFTQGFLSMFCFSIGTVPLMLGLGVLLNNISLQSKTLIYKAGGLLVLLLGLSMTSNGLSLIGIEIPSFSLSSSFEEEKDVEDVVEEESKNKDIRIERNSNHHTVQVRPYSYEDIKIKKGEEVTINFFVDEKMLNSCNNEIYIPELNKRITLKEGNNLFKFTPQEVGDFTYTCWMGMIKNKITVIE